MLLSFYQKGAEVYKFLVNGVPVELLRSFNWQWLGWMILATVVLFVIAIVMFKRGIKRYESGNLINIRV
jgi:ABC-2 type transport system permease protein